MTIPVTNAPYRAHAAMVRRRLINRLRDQGAAGTCDLAEILERCTAANRCRSGACPTCGGDFQLAVVGLVDHTIKKPARILRGRMHTVTVAPSNGCVPPDALNIDFCEQVKAELATALTAYGHPPSVYALDISYNEDSLKRISPHWCVHTHGNGLDWLAPPKVEALKLCFPPSELVKRPVKYQELDKKSKGQLYPFKPLRVRRESYIVPAKSDGSRGAYRDTRRRDLRPWQAVALALVEHQLGFRGRLITHGIAESAVEAMFEAFEWVRDGPA